MIPPRRVAPAVACLLLAGCAALRPAPPPAEPVALAGDDPLLASFVAGWAATAESRSALRAGAVLKLSGPDGSQRLKQNVVLARPSSLRMEFQSFLMTAAVLVANEARYDYFQATDGYRENGPVHPLLLWDMARVPLTLDQAVHFLMGGLPPRPGLAPRAGERAADGALRVDLHDGRGRLARRLWYEAGGRLTRAEDFGPNGQLLWQVGYDQYREVGTQPFAHRIDFEFPRFASRATVAFHRVELDPSVPEAVFELRLPGEVAPAP